MTDVAGSSPRGLRGRVLRGFLYGTIVRSVRLGLMLVFHTRVFGANNVPSRGAVLLVSNHQSNLDPPAISSSITRRQLTFVAKVEEIDLERGVIRVRRQTAGGGEGVDGWVR